MIRFSVAVMMVLLVACTSTAATTTSTTTVPPQTTTSAPPATTTPPASPPTTGETPPVPCLLVWPLQFVQAVVGEEYGFSSSTIDGTGCSFTAGASSVILSFRPGDQTAFDQAQVGAATAGEAVDLDLCDDGWMVDVGGALVIVEGLDRQGGFIFDATLSAVDDAVTAAQTLIAAACDR